MIYFVKKNLGLGCQKLGQTVGAGKTSVASISKDEENIRKEFEIFEDKQFIRDFIESRSKEASKEASKVSLIPNEILLTI